MKKLSVLLLSLAAPASSGSAELCGSAAAAVAVTDVSVQNGVVKAAGTWTAQGAASVLLEYRIDSDRTQTGLSSSRASRSPISDANGGAWTSRTRCAGACSGSARGGSVPKVASWGPNAIAFEESQERSREGTWTFHAACSPGEKVAFKVRDLGGTRETSNVAERRCGDT